MSALDDVLFERECQDEKWGEQNHDPFTYGAILMEEVGEFSQAALNARFEKIGSPDIRLEHLREEAVQVAAVALAIVECLDRKKWRWPT
jgi:NTP pyrophosphatase (non-canonical NTP hydrolase)